LLKEFPVPEFPTITHVAITISDLAVSVPWYERLIGAKPVLDEDTGTFHHTVFAIGGTLLGLHTFPGGVPAGDQFDEHRLGLDHVSFQCADRAELEQWQKHLDEIGVKHGGILDASYGSGLSFRDPDNIALEFFAPPA
jgi:catechol 2,3-dioxygenase-like lactoylglutathione lyase family enzyme